MKVKELIAKLQEASGGKNYEIIVQDDIAGGDYYMGSKILDVDFNITDENKVVMTLKIDTHDGEEEYFEFENLEEREEYSQEYDLEENMNAAQEDFSDDEDQYSDEEDDFVFVSEMRHKDYVIEFFKNKQDGKYYWQADYDGEDRKLGNFNIWITVRGISLYSEDEEGYPTKAAVVAKAKEWVNKQKRRWDESIKTGKSNLLNDSITEDADKVMGTYKGYTIKQNVDGDIYVLKKSGEKEFFNSWKEAYNAITTGTIKDSITEDAEIYSYQFPPLTAKDLEKANDYELLEVKKVGKDIVLKGSLENLKRFAEKYLGYELVKEYLIKDSLTEDVEDDEDDYSNDYDFYVEYYQGTSPIPKFKEAFDTLEEAKQYATNNLIKNKKLEVREIYICTEGINGPVQHDAWFKSINNWYSKHYNESNDDANLIVRY